MDEAFIKRAVKFGFTGVGVTLIHVAVAIFLIEIMDLNPALANGFAFAVATAVSYVANTLWSFSDKLSGRTLYRFLSVSALGSFVAMLCSGSVDRMGGHYLLGILAVVLVVPGLTFLLHNFWTYREKT
jgi:putative flippase GtrA